MELQLINVLIYLLEKINVAIRVANSSGYILFQRKFASWKRKKTALFCKLIYATFQ